MRVELKDKVQAVAEFMQANVPACRLRATAEANALLAPLIWEHHEKESIVAARLAALPISLDGLRIQPSSTAHLLAQSYAGDDSEGGEIAPLRRQPLFRSPSIGRCRNVRERFPAYKRCRMKRRRFA